MYEFDILYNERNAKVLFELKVTIFVIQKVKFELKCF